MLQNYLKHFKGLSLSLVYWDPTIQGSRSEGRAGIRQRKENDLAKEYLQPTRSPPQDTAETSLWEVRFGLIYLLSKPGLHKWGDELRCLTSGCLLVLALWSFTLFGSVFQGQAFLPVQSSPWCPQILNYIKRNQQKQNVCVTKHTKHRHVLNKTQQNTVLFSIWEQRFYQSIPVC